MALIEITTTNPVFAEREPLFSIDGVEYTIPKEISGSVALAFLEEARNHGEALAVGWLLKEVLGEESHAALVACKTVTGPQMAAVVTVVRERTMAAMEAMQGE